MKELLELLNDFLAILGFNEELLTADERESLDFIRDYIQEDIRKLN